MYENDTETPAPDSTEEPEKETEDTGINICRTCWCDTCAKKEECDAFPASADGTKPPPCAACPDNAISPLMPKKAPAECGTYEALPEDCRACWCRGCPNFVNCIIEKEGYDLASKPCPCDGCGRGERYMPKESPPTCEYYTTGGGQIEG